MGKTRFKIFLLATAILMVIAACKSGISPQEDAGLPAQQSDLDQPRETNADQSAETAAPGDQIEATPTPDNRLPPEEWQEWPVIPTLSPTMIKLYEQGIQSGNRDNAFSKVGDCQIIPDVFLGTFDEITYSLPEGMENLQGTLERFQGSFAREGYALKGGFVFPTVFSPLRADSSVCEPGETPYECELRVHQPAFVLISMEFRYDGRTVDTHEKYLRRAVEYALDRGIVPILATKADNFEGDHSLNLTTARIAYEYDIPLWNYWRAVQYLPGHGIDWERDSYGFHVTPEAWLVRSESFLKVLDSLVSEIDNSSSDTTALQAAAQTPESTPAIEIRPTLQASELSDPENLTAINWASGGLVFDLKEREFGDIKHLGIYLADLESGQISQITEQGYQLHGVSPDFQLLLVSKGKSLAVIQLNDLTSLEISSHYYAASPSGAAWDQFTNQIFYLSDESGKPALNRYDWSSGLGEQIPGADPVSILLAEQGTLVWTQGSCNPFGDCNLQSLHWSDAGGRDQAVRDIGDAILLPCQTGDAYVYANRAEDKAISFHIQSLDTGKETIFGSLNTEYSDCDWNPMTNQAAVTIIDRGWYSGIIQEYHLQLLDPQTYQIQDISFVLDLMRQVTWSPDGKYLAISGTASQEDRYQVALGILEVETLTTTSLDIPLEFQSSNYLTFNQLHWLP